MQCTTEPAIERYTQQMSHQKLQTSIQHTAHIQTLMIFIYVHVAFHSGIKSNEHIFQSIENFNRQGTKEVSELFSIGTPYLSLILFFLRKNGLIGGNESFRVRNPSKR